MTTTTRPPPPRRQQQPLQHQHVLSQVGLRVLTVALQCTGAQCNGQAGVDVDGWSALLDGLLCSAHVHVQRASRCRLNGLSALTGKAGFQQAGRTPPPVHALVSPPPRMGRKQGGEATKLQGRGNELERGRHLLRG